MKCKVKSWAVFHSKTDKGVPIVYRPGDIVEFNGPVVPIQLEVIKEVKKTKATS